MSENPIEDPGTCQECGEAPSTVHIRRVSTEGDEIEIRLCLECARKQGLEPDMDPDIGGHLDPVAVLFKNLGEMDGGGGICGGCGISYSVFRETGRLGCAQCYTAFASELKPLIRRVHGEVRHVGKVPLPEGGAYDQAARLRRLNDDLERAIGSEEFERAAEIRDLIQELESTGSGSRSHD